MSRNPEAAAAASTDRLQIDEAVTRALSALAERHGEAPAKILREVRKGSPAGRLILKLCGLGNRYVLNGRPPDDQRFETIYEVLRRLERETGNDAEAVKLAPRALAELGIRGPTGHPLTVKSLRQVRKNLARYWFENLEN